MNLKRRGKKKNSSFFKKFGLHYDLLQKKTPQNGEQKIFIIFYNANPTHTLKH